MSGITDFTIGSPTQRGLTNARSSSFSDPLASGTSRQLEFSRTDGQNRWTWVDNIGSTSGWIAGSVKHGFVTTPYLSANATGYVNSTIPTEGAACEIHCYDPANIAKGMNGTILPWNVQPTTMKVITADMTQVCQQ